jgi:hypothetical protein
MRGKTLDMAALIARNPHAVAVGNASMNARGDIISRRGAVLKPREQIAMDYHASNPRSVKSVGIKSLSAEMFTTPAEAWASGQAAKAATHPKPTAEAARKRKLVEPSDHPDGGV